MHSSSAADLALRSPPLPLPLFPYTALAGGARSQPSVKAQIVRLPRLPRPTEKDNKVDAAGMTPATAPRAPAHDMTTKAKTAANVPNLNTGKAPVVRSLGFSLAVPRLRFRHLGLAPFLPFLPAHLHPHPPQPHTAQRRPRRHATRRPAIAPRPARQQPTGRAGSAPPLPHEGRAQSAGSVVPKTPRGRAGTARKAAHHRTPQPTPTQLLRRSLLLRKRADISRFGVTSLQNLGLKGCGTNPSTLPLRGRRAAVVRTG